MARKGILTSSGDTPKTPRKTPERMMPRGAVGALQSSLSRLQENAVQEIDPNLIDQAGVTDRLGTDDAADTALLESLRTYGQQVPVLLRPNADTAGRFDIVYGRRRVVALKTLGLPVKAMIRQLDDQALILAQGQENTARQDLSFIEKASFAAQLDASDYDRVTIAAALSIDLPMVSRLLKVGHAFDLAFLRKIGSAPGIGRDRWMALANAMATESTRKQVARHLAQLEKIPASDDRFEQVLAWATGDLPKKTGARPPARKRPVTLPDGTQVADLKRGPKALTVTLPSGGTNGFDAWLEANADAVLADLHTRWKAEWSDE